ncbi:MAG: YkgJ family cysteine cluster protein, partial [Nitrosopumilaceae archaeon]
MRKELEESLELLSKDWDVDPIIRNFILGNRDDVSEFAVKVKDVVFHIPYLTKENSYIIWKCFWPDCHNCCNRQGRLPLTSDDLITISKSLKYQKTSDFIKNETNIDNWQEIGPSGNVNTMTMINLK